MKENEKKLLLYNALDGIYNDNELYDMFNFFYIKTIFLNDTYISVEKGKCVKISLDADGISIDIDAIVLKVRYEDLTNFSFWTEE